MRNYQVRNFLRDTMRKGDQGFFYHSSCDVPGVCGVVRVVRAGYRNPVRSIRSTVTSIRRAIARAPRWYSVDVHLERRIEPVITLETLRKHAQGALSEMLILRRGNRLVGDAGDARRVAFHHRAQ